MARRQTLFAQAKPSDDGALKARYRPAKAASQERASKAKAPKARRQPAGRDVGHAAFLGRAARERGRGTGGRKEPGQCAFR